MSAWLMAVVLRGMSRAEIAALTDAMLHSGRSLDFSDLPGAKVDKHSTGGVGDKTSLVIAPDRGRAGGLRRAHDQRARTGPHRRHARQARIHSRLQRQSLARGVSPRARRTCGCALIGQTAEIAPADKKIYALRDVTATVESPALICASIMSKKLAEGIDALVLDVKTGSGAFMKTEEDAANLAELLVETGTRMGKHVVALVTDMDQPLGRTAGNALEVIESLEVLGGGGPADLRELCLELPAGCFSWAARRVRRGGPRTGRRADRSGRAKEKFREIVRCTGGDAASSTIRSACRARATRSMWRARRAGTSPRRNASNSAWPASSWVAAGQERRRHRSGGRAGVSQKAWGSRSSAASRLCTLHYNSAARLDEARRLVETSYRIAAEPPTARPLVQRVIGV